MGIIYSRTGILGLVLGTVPIWSQAEEAASRKPNIVFFLADDCTWWDIGCYGSQDARTPHIDRLASEGMRFTRFYQASPMCSPTRHNLFTGIYPVRSGAYPNHTFVDPGTQTIIDFLEPAGYRVALSGKRHVAPEEVFRFEYLGQGNNPDFKKVEAFIADVSRKKEPFCLFLCSNEPHTPWNLGNPETYDPDNITLPPFMVDTRETRNAFVKYLAEIEYLDGQVGSAANLLLNYGLEENTIFIFSSEQGNSFPFAKWTCYDAGLRTAFILKYPGAVEAGSVSDALADYTDVVPTLVDLAGEVVPGGLDGLSFSAVVYGETSGHKDYSFGLQTSRGIFSGPEKFGIRTVTNGKYRLIQNLNPDQVFKNIVTERDKEWWPSWETAALTDAFAEQQVNAYRHRPPYELFNNETDPYNMVNLYDNPYFGDIISQLKEKLREWMDYCGDKGAETEQNAFDRLLRNRPPE